MAKAYSVYFIIINNTLIKKMVVKVLSFIPKIQRTLSSN